MGYRETPSRYRTPIAATLCGARPWDIACTMPNLMQNTLLFKAALQNRYKIQSLHYAVPRLAVIDHGR